MNVCAQEKMPWTWENVTAACPSHLIIFVLSMAKDIGPVYAAAPVKKVKATIHSGGEPGNIVRFCPKCDFPIAIYGMLNPCEHAFCMDCAMGSNFEQHIQKIQKIRMGKGQIFVYGTLSCLKSFCEIDAFKRHVAEVHGSSTSSVRNGGDGDLHLQPMNTLLHRPTAN